MAVSTASTPTAKYSSCIWRMRSGRVSDEVLVAALEGGAAEVVGAEVLALDPGPEGAVEDQDPLVGGGEEVRHRRAKGYRSVPCVPASFPAARGRCRPE